MREIDFVEAWNDGETLGRRRSEYRQGLRLKALCNGGSVNTCYRVDRVSTYDLHQPTRDIPRKLRDF